MGLADFLGNIGILPARKPTTPPLLPPVGPTGMTDAQIGLQRRPAPQPDISVGDENFDEFGQLSQSPASQIGGIGNQPAQPKFQSAEDRLQETLNNPPKRQKSSLWREIGGNILMASDSPIGKTLGSRLAYGDYPRQLQEYQANVANQTLAADQSRKSAEEQRKIQHDAETLAATKDNRAAVNQDRDDARKLRETQATASMIGAGAEPYVTPPPVNDEIPSEIPGVGPHKVTVPSPPKPPGVIESSGQSWRIPEKTRGGMTYLEPEEAKALDLSGRLVNGKVEVPTTAYKQAITPEKPATQNRDNWIAILSNPLSSAGAKSAAKASLDEDDRRFKSRQNPPDKGQNFVDPATGKLVRVEPGGDVPKGGMTASGFSTVNAPTSQSRAMSEMAKTVLEQTPDLLAQVDRLKEKIGPVAGRWNNFWVNKGGVNDPDYAGLDQDLDLFASALVRTHFGARGGQGYREALKKDFSAAQSPEDLKARIQHAETWIKGYAKMTDRKPSGGTQVASPIVQQSPSTGQFRHSLDGGKTWLPGQPPK